MTTIQQPKRYHYTESDGVQGIGWITEDLKSAFVTYQDWLALYQDYTTLENKLEKPKRN